MLSPSDFVSPNVAGLLYHDSSRRRSLARGVLMLEVEMKFPAADFTGIERLLAERGAVAQESLEEVDHYFNAPDRDFAQTDEALRLRRIGPANYATYKGPKRDAQTKT